MKPAQTSKRILAHQLLRRQGMSDLIVIGYPDETTAEAAAAEARRLVVMNPSAPGFNRECRASQPGF